MKAHARCGQQATCHGPIAVTATLDLGTIDGARVLLRAGDTFSLPAGKYHRPLNASDDELEFEATLTPGLDAAEMFASLYAATRGSCPTMSCSCGNLKQTLDQHRCALNTSNPPL